jgi:hypothetical protein
MSASPFFKEYVMYELDCLECDNIGYIEDEEGLPVPCNYCNGEGEVYMRKQVDDIIDIIKSIRHEIFYTKRFSIPDVQLWKYLDTKLSNIINIIDK